MEDVRICRNGRIALEDRTFSIDKNNKENYLLGIENIGTRNNVKGALLKLDDYEQAHRKHIIDFSYEECEEFLSSLNSKSKQSIGSFVSKIKKYLTTIYSNDVLENVAFLKVKDFEKYINREEFGKKCITYRQLIKFENIIYNSCDKCFLELLFNGIKADEITTLKPEDIDFINRTIKVTDNKGKSRVVKGCTDRCFELAEKTIKQKTYVLNNGSDINRRNHDEVFQNGLGIRQEELPESIYLFKSTDGTDCNKPVSTVFLQNRLRVMRDWINNKSISVKSIYQSGILHAAYEIMQKTTSDELDRATVAMLAERFNYCNAYTDDGVIDASVGRLQDLIKVGIKHIYRDDYYINTSEYFNIDCDYVNLISHNVELESIVDIQNTEGAEKEYYVTRYERNPLNRKNAINIHGLTCCVCGFNFKEFYGTIGENFIEVHHIKPLHSLDEEITINPETDLVCLCSNCHSMIHHKKDSILTVDELKNLIRKKTFSYI